MYLVNRLAWIKRMIEGVMTKYYYLKISLSEAGHCQDTGTNVDLGKWSGSHKMARLSVGE